MLGFPRSQGKYVAYAFPLREWDVTGPALRKSLIRGLHVRVDGTIQISVSNSASNIFGLNDQENQRGIGTAESKYVPQFFATGIVSAVSVVALPKREISTFLPIYPEALFQNGRNSATVLNSKRRNKRKYTTNHGRFILILK